MIGDLSSWLGRKGRGNKHVFPMRNKDKDGCMLLNAFKWREAQKMREMFRLISVFQLFRFYCYIYIYIYMLYLGYIYTKNVV